MLTTANQVYDVLVDTNNTHQEQLGVEQYSRRCFAQNSHSCLLATPRLIQRAGLAYETREGFRVVTRMDIYDRCELVPPKIELLSHLSLLLAYTWQCWRVGGPAY